MRFVNYKYVHQCEKTCFSLSLSLPKNPHLTLLLHHPWPPLDHHTERNTLIKAESSKPTSKIWWRTELSTILSWFLRGNHDYKLLDVFTLPLRMRRCKSFLFIKLMSFFLCVFYIIGSICMNFWRHARLCFSSLG